MTLSDICEEIYLSFLQLLQLFLQLPAATWQHSENTLRNCGNFSSIWSCLYDCPISKWSAATASIYNYLAMQNKFWEIADILQCCHAVMQWDNMCNCAWVCVLQKIDNTLVLYNPGPTTSCSFSSPIDKTCVRKGSVCSAAVAQLPGSNLAWPENKTLKRGKVLVFRQFSRATKRTYVSD